MFLIDPRNKGRKTLSTKKCIFSELSVKRKKNTSIKEQEVKSQLKEMPEHVFIMMQEQIQLRGQF